MTEMTLSEFIQNSIAARNGNSWEISITLKNGQKSILGVDVCHSEYEAKERAYNFLLTLIGQKQ